ncbi:hypothetical protein CIL06_02455 [Pantoea vagans]|nr:hypothetical protein CIL06_02455 [Pantoea vagans]
MWITLCVTAYNSGFCCGMQRTRFFMHFMGCASARTPYNAPPSTRNTGNGKRVRGTGDCAAGEKLLRKRLTLQEESVIYATSRQDANALFALLFNNLSDNLCGHSQD